MRDATKAALLKDARDTSKDIYDAMSELMRYHRIGVKDGGQSPLGNGEVQKVAAIKKLLLEANRIAEDLLCDVDAIMSDD